MSTLNTNCRRIYFPMQFLVSKNGIMKCVSDWKTFYCIIRYMRAITITTESLYYVRGRRSRLLYTVNLSWSWPGLQSPHKVINDRQLIQLLRLPTRHKTSLHMINCCLLSLFLFLLRFLHWHTLTFSISSRIAGRTSGGQQRCGTEVLVVHRRMMVHFDGRSRRRRWASPDVVIGHSGPRLSPVNQWTCFAVASHQQHWHNYEERRTEDYPHGCWWGAGGAFKSVNCTNWWWSLFQRTHWLNIVALTENEMKRRKCITFSMQG